MEEFHNSELYHTYSHNDSLSLFVLQEYIKLAEEDKQRYITEMEEFQNSELYQTFLKSKKTSGDMVKGFTDGSNNSLIDIEVWKIEIRDFIFFSV